MSDFDKALEHHGFRDFEEGRNRQRNVEKFQGWTNAAMVPLGLGFGLLGHHIASKTTKRKDGESEEDYQKRRRTRHLLGVGLATTIGAGLGIAGDHYGSKYFKNRPVNKNAMLEDLRTNSRERQMGHKMLDDLHLPWVAAGTVMGGSLAGRRTVRKENETKDDYENRLMKRIMIGGLVGSTISGIGLGLSHMRKDKTNNDRHNEILAKMRESYKR